MTHQPEEPGERERPPGYGWPPPGGGRYVDPTHRPTQPEHRQWPAPPVTPRSADPEDGPPFDTSEERLWATLGHLGGVLAFVPFLALLPSLLIYLLLRRRSGFVADQSLEALNFQLCVLVVGIGIRVLEKVGLPGGLGLVLWILSAVFSVLGAVAANRGEKYRYPFTHRFLT